MLYCAREIGRKSSSSTSADGAAQLIRLMDPQSIIFRRKPRTEGGVGGRGDFAASRSGGSLTSAPASPVYGTEVEASVLSLDAESFMNAGGGGGGGGGYHSHISQVPEEASYSLHPLATHDVGLNPATSETLCTVFATYCMVGGGRWREGGTRDAGSEGVSSLTDFSPSSRVELVAVSKSARHGLRRCRLSKTPHTPSTQSPRVRTLSRPACSRPTGS